MKKILAVLLTAILFLSSFAALAEEEPDYTIGMFEKPVTAEEGTPYVVITFDENPAPLTYFEEFDGGEGWLFLTHITNLSDRAVTLTGVTMVDFKEDRYSVHPYGPETVEAFFDGNHVLDPEEVTEFWSGFPLQDIIGVGYSVTYTDETGSEYETHAWLPFLAEHIEG